jgi:hypothetical protein
MNSRKLLMTIALFVMVWTTAPSVQADPTGSYQQTCIDIGVSGTTLAAQCRTRASQYVQTTLANYHQCIGDISNNNGQLQCNKDATPPTGSYSESCTNIFINNGVLSASCKTINGGIVNAQLGNLPACLGDIANINGNLTCPTGTSPPPSGSYESTCETIVVSGASLKATCLTKNQGLRTTTVPNFKTCIWGISNVDGYLSCDTGDEPKGGSYQASCIDIATSGETIHAQCEAPDGSLHSTSMTIPPTSNNCGDIENQNGQLICTVCEVGGQCIH